MKDLVESLMLQSRKIYIEKDLEASTLMRSFSVDVTMGSPKKDTHPRKDQ